jgi:hypothetical protein
MGTTQPLRYRLGVGVQERGESERFRAERTSRDTLRGACLALAFKELGEASISVGDAT